MMNKNLKKIIALAMVIGTTSAVAPATHANILTTKAFASSSDNDDDSFSSLKLETSDGSGIKLYDADDYDNKVSNDDVDSGTDYYAKTSSASIKLDIDGVSSKYVRVFKSDDDDISESAKGKKLSDDISLSSGDNTIVVRIYSEEPDGSIRYDEEDDQLNDYTIHVKCTADDSDDSSDESSSDSSDDSSDNYDDIYLSSLSVDGESISLSDSETTYTYNVAKDVDSVSIKARPQDKDEDTVEIDGDEVTSDDSYKKDVDLDKGENTIKVKVEDEDSNERQYTLKITRGDSSSSGSTTSSSTSTSSTSTSSTSGTSTSGTTTTDTSTTSQATTTIMSNQWIQINGGWQYNDSTGQPLKSQWFFDRNYGKWYYLGTDGMMAANTWLQSGSKWYFINSNGAMAANAWLQSGSKWYYLNSDGAMAVSTTINGYKIGADGAWIK